jgi:hypothetical protein
MVQVVENLPCKHETWSSNPNTIKKKNYYRNYPKYVKLSYDVPVRKKKKRDTCLRRIFLTIAPAPSFPPCKLPFV